MTPTTQTAPAQPHAGPREGAPFVLIVDDDKYNLRLVSIQVRDLWPHARIETAETGEEALEKALSQRPDLVISDVRLPGPSGVDVIWKLRQSPGAVPTKVVIMTGYHDPETHKLAIELGADDYLTKPMDPQTLRRSLVSLMGLGPFNAHPTPPQVPGT